MEAYTLIAYLKGELEAETCREVEAWLNLSDENRKTVESLYVLMFIDRRIQAKNEINVNEAFEAFQRKKRISQTVGKTIPLWRKISTVAAVFLILLLSGTFITLAILERNSQPVLVSTKLGERAQVTLPDGSKVWLNACSCLKYKKSFFSRKRSAELKGEAYFEVAHNGYLPFIVSSDNSEIKVLGTKFNVRCNDDENYLSTVLVEGAIAFSDERADVYVKIKPREELIFDKTTHRFHLKNHSNPNEVLGWIDGKLLFENTSLEEIAKSLERYYNVRIRFADEKVKQKRFNAEFEMTDNIYQILSILELTNKFTYKINKRDITVFSR